MRTPLQLTGEAGARSAPDEGFAPLASPSPDVLRRPLPRAGEEY
jgi:hypothetical protein